MIAMDTAKFTANPEVGSRRWIATNENDQEDLSRWRHMENKGMNVVFVDGHTKMMGYHDIPGDTKPGLGNRKQDPNSFWAQWKN